STVPLAPAPEPEDPLVERFPAGAERLLQVRIRPSDEAVERHRDFERQCHRVLRLRVRWSSLGPACEAELIADLSRAPRGRALPLRPAPGRRRWRPRSARP